MPRKKKEEDNKETFSVDTDSITKEVMAYVDSQLDKKVEKVVDESIRRKVIDEIEKANKKVIRMKNHRIFVGNVFLFLFFLVIVFLVYLLYSEHYFDRYFSHSSNMNDIVQEVPVKKQDIEKTSLDNLKEKYASYLDPYVLSEKSTYLEDFYQGKLTNELKNYYSLIQMDFSKFEVDDDYNMIDASSVKDVCLSLFDGDCELVSFDYNGNNVRYFKKLASYITNNVLLRESSLIRREIIDIQEENNVVYITTLEGIIVDEHIYSVYPYEYVDDYSGGSLSNYDASLNKITYTFKDKKLVSIEKG